MTAKQPNVAQAALSAVRCDNLICVLSKAVDYVPAVAIRTSMSAWKHVYPIFSRIALMAFLLTNVLAASGCSDPIAAANAKGTLAQVQLESGQLAAARKTIADAIADRDDIPQLHLLRAHIELQAKSPATAYSAYSSALALDSANMEALIGVAQLGLQLGHVSESEDATDRILAIDPNQPSGLLLSGLHSIIKRRYQGAVDSADAILKQSPTDENALILKARALSLMNKPDEAFAAADVARKSSGETLSLALTLLELYRLRDDGASMVAQLERIRRLSPGNPDYDIDEADTLYKLGQSARAREIVSHRLLDTRLDEKTSSELVGLWREYDSDPLDPAALADFGRKAGLPAKKAVARLYLGRNDSARAEAALGAAPPVDDILALRARAGAMRGALDQSLAQVESILANDHTHCDALIVKAQVLLARRRADDAVQASTLATTTCPQMPDAFLTLVHAQEADGNKAGAAIAFRDAFDRNGQDSALVRSYTAWLEQQGKGARAVGIARLLTRNAPSLLSGWALYGELCGRIAMSDCSAEAAAGLARARRRFGVDRRLDEPPSTGLFGRLARE